MVFVSRISSPENFKKELPAPREDLKKAGCGKNVGKKRKVKHAHG